jgi:predicted RNA binding protein YcfA (HicA-like mRNA interferase family)
LGRYKILSGIDICDILAENGFVLRRQKGSHLVMQMVVNNSTITVVVPNHKEIKIGTLKSIIRQSGLRSSLFQN